MKKTLAGKLALVTGSSRGIGRQIALGLAEYGADVIVHGRKLDHLNETLELLMKYDVESYGVEGDLSNPEGVSSVIAGVEKIRDGIDILYNNAAINEDEIPILECKIEVWHRIFSVNLFAMVELCNAFIPYMVNNKYGRVVNLTSGIADKPEYAAYSASKAAVDKYSRDLAFAIQNENVLVNYLDPGWLKTDMGGIDALFDVESVIPGALVPALLDDYNTTGKFFMAQDFKNLI